jgi:hypothetical protein
MKIFYRVGLIVFISLFCAIVALILIGNALESRLVNYTINMVNKELPSPLHYKSAKLSLFRNFPRASIILKDVNLVDKTSSTEILALNEIRLTFNLLKALKNEYILNSVVLKNGRMNLALGTTGDSFWNSFQTAQPQSNSPFLLNFKSIQVVNVNVLYTNAETGWLSNVEVIRSTISGKIHKSTYLFNVLLLGKAVTISQNDFIYLSNSPIDLAFKLKVDEDRLVVEGGNLLVEDSMLGLDLDFGRKNESPIRVSIGGKNVKTEVLLNFIAQKEVTLPAGAKSKGAIDFNLLIEGTKGSSVPFAFSSTFKTQQLNLSFDGFPSFNISNLSGRFSNGSSRNSSTTEVLVTFDEVRTTKSKISGAFRMRNPQHPKIYFNGNSQIDFSDIVAIVPDFPLQSGKIIGKIELLGTIPNSDSLSLSDVKDLKGDGHLTLTEISGSFYNQKLNFSNVSGDMQLLGKTIIVSNAKGLINGASFSGGATLQNAFNSLFAGEKLYAKGDLSLDFFDTNWFFNENKNVVESMDLNSNYTIGEIQGSVFIRNFKHQGFIGNGVKAFVSIFPGQYIFRGIEGKACLGSFAGQIAIDESHRETQKILSVMSLVDVDISSLFEAFDNFGQETLKSTNVSGKVSGNANFSVALENWSIQTQKLVADANVQIKNGKLQDLTQLEGLSRFISLEELKNVSFNTLENNIRIENGMITIPKMEVSSSVMDFLCSGTHSFTNDYSYRIRLNLTDVLFRKATKSKPENSTFGEIQSDGTGRTRLYLKIEGNSNTQKVSYDGSAAREDFRYTVKKEKETLKQAINEEFNTIFKRKSPADSIATSNEGQLKTIKKKEEDQKNKFKIEWDDN